MNTRLNLKIQGEVTLLENNKEIFKQSNNITGDALEIIMRSLSKVPNEISVDVIKLAGDYGEQIIPVTDSIWDPTEGSITFIGLISTDQAVGETSSLRLRSSLLEKNLAQKIGLSITKGDTIQIEVRWKITITNC